MTTLQQALQSGRGTERSFHCPVHDDQTASASVNVLKGVWFCYACGARGKVDGVVDIDPYDLAKEIDDLLDIEQLCFMPESMLSLFTGPCEYWESRFTQEAISHFSLGFDPMKEMPCYPMRTSSGRLLGVVYRNSDPTSKRRYKYPYGIKATNYLFNYTHSQKDTVVLVEGATDAIALWEAGIEAFAIYGSNPTWEQMRLVAKLDPKRIVLAFDMDRAGHKATVEMAAMAVGYEVIRAEWDDNHGKDPGELTKEQRCNFIGNLVL